jgi:hypothetical protein
MEMEAISRQAAMGVVIIRELAAEGFTVMEVV